MQGTVKTLKNGFGFIQYEGSDKDIFFHANELEGVAFDDIKEGDSVTFEIGEGKQGPNAIKVNKA